MKQVEIYTKSWCPYCHRAKGLLDARGLAFDEIDVTGDGAREQEMMRRSQRGTVPQIFVDGEHVGGFDDLLALQASGELDGVVVRG